MIDCIASRRTKVGLIVGGLGAYWPQFPDLLPALQRSAARVSERMQAIDYGVDAAARRPAKSRAGISHHWALGTGHLMGELRATADLLGTELVEVSP